MKELILNKITELTGSGKLDEIVTAEVSKAIKDIIASSLRSYGDVGKALEAKMQKELLNGIERLDFVEYASGITQLIESELNKSIVENAIAPVKKMLKNFMGALEKKEWKLSEIIAQFIENEVVADQDPNESGEISLIVKKSDYGTTWIGFDKDGGKDQDYSCEYRIAVDEKGRLWFFTNERRKISPFTQSNLSHFETFLFKLQATNAVVTLDEHACQTEWSTYND